VTASSSSRRTPITEADTNNNGVANCYLKSRLGNLNYTNAIQKRSGWKFRACYAVLSCANLSSATSWKA